MKEIEISNQGLRKKLTGRALIIFISMLILLTFFSNTINNFTLPRVTVEQPVTGDIIKDISGEGYVEPTEIKEHYTQLNTLVEDVKAEEGDHVKKGQTIMILDTKEIKRNIEDETAQYEQKKLQLEKLVESSSPDQLSSYVLNISNAEKKVSQKQKDFDDINQLYKIGAETQKNLEAAENELIAAKQEYETAKYNQQQALKDVQRDIKILQYDIGIQQRKIEKLKEDLAASGPVAAPCDGIIADINFTGGSVANNSKPLFTIIDLSKGFRLKVVLDREKTDYLKVGDTVSVTLDTVSDKEIDCKISEISDNDDNKGEKENVLVDIPIGGLTGGEPGEINITKKIENKKGVLVSNDAIHEDSSGQYILVVKEKEGPLGKEYYVQEARISSGESDDSRTSVEGIMMIEQVVVKSSKTVEDGDKVIVEK